MPRIDMPAFLEERNADDLIALLADVLDDRLLQRDGDDPNGVSRTELREDDRIRWYLGQLAPFGSGSVNVAERPPTPGDSRPTHIRPAANDG